MKTLQIPAAKNSVLPLLTIPTLIKGKYTFNNIELFTDIHEQLKVLSLLNIKHQLIKQTLYIDSTNMLYPKEINITQEKTTRAITYFMGSLVLCNQKVIIDKPGGCAIGDRKLDLHFDYLKQLDITIQETDTKYIIDYTKYNHHKSIKYNFTKISVGATINSILSSINGKTGDVNITNIATDPYIEDIIHILNQCGFNISFNKKDRSISFKRRHIISIDQNINFTPCQDPIIIGSYIVLCIIFHKKYYIPIHNLDHLGSFTTFLHTIGIKYTKYKNNQYVFYSDPHFILPEYTEIITSEYPGFYTDLQPLALILCNHLKVKTTIIDNIMNGRFKYTNELAKIGYQIKFINNTKVLYTGFTKNTTYDTFYITDLRGGFVVYIELNKYGIKYNHIHNLDIIKRGYNINQIQDYFFN
jgi:UDP-N-acetylglucosamine 1-carboxyvinyltransferase